jgi:hypothetical protein
VRLDKPDVVVALTDPPIIGLAAWLAGKRFGAPLVMSYRDLFPEVTVLLEDFHSDTINQALQRVNQFLVGARPSTSRSARPCAGGSSGKGRSRGADDRYSGLGGRPPSHPVKDSVRAPMDSRTSSS